MIDGQEQVMIVTRPLDYAHQFIETPWRQANVHLLKELGGKALSVTVGQQIDRGGEEGLPYILRRHGQVVVRAVEIGPDIYKRLDEMAARYDNPKAMASAVKNMLAKRAIEVAL